MGAVVGAQMTLDEWATRWGVPPQAIAELVALNHGAPEPLSRPVESESALQSLVRLEAARKGKYLWRNNNGAFKDETGRWVRFGLANDSPKLSKQLKSADLIGIESVLITPDMVGKIIGRFLSRELKKLDWTWSGTEEEEAQLRWATLINRMGGNAAIVNFEGSL